MMHVCAGSRGNAHDEIVHDNGSNDCPVCALTKERDALAAEKIKFEKLADDNASEVDTLRGMLTELEEKSKKFSWVTEEVVDANTAQGA